MHAQAMGLMGEALDAGDVARFLRVCPGLSKTTIGELLGEPSEFWLSVLANFVSTFDFAGARLLVTASCRARAAVLATYEQDDTSGCMWRCMGGMWHKQYAAPTLLNLIYAKGLVSSCRQCRLTMLAACAGLDFDSSLRMFLQSFRLPGEAQKIARVLESFSSAYHTQCPGVFRNADAAYVLSYSVIMLNTDQHNKQVRCCTSSKYSDAIVSQCLSGQAAQAFCCPAPQVNLAIACS